MKNKMKFTIEVDVKEEKSVEEPLTNSDFLYVKTSEGKWIALYKGVVKSNRSSMFMGGTFCSKTYDRINWGTIYNPPRPPTEVPYNPIQNLESFELTFQNPVPDEWLNPGFYLEFEGIKFRINSTSCDKAGNCLTTAESAYTGWK